jgi:RNA polymerase sigma factor (sigma-70 family)
VNHAHPMPAKASDAELLACIGAGELGSLGILFDRYAVDVGRFMARLGACSGEIDDLVQATFLDVVRAAGSFDGRASARNWLLGIARMTVRRNQRSLARLRRRLVAWGNEPVAPQETPGQSFERRQATGRAIGALARLSSKKREVFVMVVLEGMSGEEAAGVLGIPLSTVWTRLHHARRELRRELVTKETP